MSDLSVRKSVNVRTQFWLEETTTTTLIFFGEGEELLWSSSNVAMTLLFLHVHVFPSTLNNQLMHNGVSIEYLLNGISRFFPCLLHCSWKSFCLSSSVLMPTLDHWLQARPDAQVQGILLYSSIAALVPYPPPLTRIRQMGSCYGIQGICWWIWASMVSMVSRMNWELQLTPPEPCG